MRLDRSIFLYMEPAPGQDSKNYAQCGRCMMWNTATGKEANRCHILGPRFLVLGDDTCGIFVPGPPHKAKLVAAVTPEVAGFERRKIRCENCGAYRSKPGQSRGKCAAFEMMTKWKPAFFSLDPDVAAKGCCNANHPKRA